MIGSSTCEHAYRQRAARVECGGTHTENGPGRANERTTVRRHPDATACASSNRRSPLPLSDGSPYPRAWHCASTVQALCIAPEYERKRAQSVPIWVVPRALQGASRPRAVFRFWFFFSPVTVQRRCRNGLQICKKHRKPETVCHPRNSESAVGCGHHQLCRRQSCTGVLSGCRHVPDFGTNLPRLCRGGVAIQHYRGLSAVTRGCCGAQPASFRNRRFRGRLAGRNADCFGRHTGD